MSKRSLNPKTQRAIDREKLWIAREFFLKPGVIKASSHGLRSGSTDDYYFDLDYVLNEPYQAEMVLDIYASMTNAIKQESSIDFLAFIEKASGGTIGALRLSVALSIKTRLPNLSVRLRKEISFEKIKARPSNEGLEGLRAVIVSDHCTSGNEVLLAAQALRKQGVLVEDAVVYTIRPDKIRWDNLRESNINLRCAFKLPLSYEMVPKAVEDLRTIAVAVNF
jgi:orotate phosphoribosyltransferase